MRDQEYLTDRGCFTSLVALCALASAWERDSALYGSHEDVSMKPTAMVGRGGPRKERKSDSVLGVSIHDPKWSNTVYTVLNYSIGEILDSVVMTETNEYCRETAQGRGEGSMNNVSSKIIAARFSTLETWPKRFVGTPLRATDHHSSLPVAHNSQVINVWFLSFR